MDAKDSEVLDLYRKIKIAEKALEKYTRLLYFTIKLNGWEEDFGPGEARDALAKIREHKG